MSGRIIKRGVLLTAGFCGAVFVFAVLWKSAGAAIEHDQALMPVFSASSERESTVPEEMFTLPAVVDGTCLIAERIAVYDGPFLEDGSDKEVFNVTALVLRNASDQGVEKARVILKAGEHCLIFEASQIPAGEAVVVLEKNRTAYGITSFSSCTGWALAGTGDWTFPDLLTVEDVDLGTICVTNLSDAPLENIRLYYKTCLSEAGVNVGGITYELVVERVEAGQSVLLEPYHYASGYSRIVRIGFDGDA